MVSTWAWLMSPEGILIPAEGVSSGLAISVTLLLLLLFGLLTAFRKAVRLLPAVRAHENAPEAASKRRLLHSFLKDPLRLDRRITLALVLVGAAYFYWGSLVTVPSLIRMAGPLSLSLRAWLTLAWSLLHLFLLLLLGLVIPQRAAGRKEGVLARRLFPFLLPLLLLAGALDGLLSVLGGLILKILRLPEIEIPEPAPTEEEFLQMLEAGHAKGAIEDDNRELIANLFEFDDKIAAEVMTHRTEIDALPLEASLSETMALLYETKYTRYPVYEGSIDKIIGILHAKDLLFYREQPGGDGPFSLEEIMRPAWFTPETRNISDLFREMQKNHTQMAIVIDEYGGTAGLLTIEDLVEQIVGSIEDEYDDVEQELIEITPDTWLVDGTYPLDRLARVTGVHMDDEYDTVAGLLIDLLDRIPEEDERPVVEYGPLTFHVLAISDNRIVRVRLVKHETGEEEGNDL